MLDGAAFVDELDGFGGPHEPKTPVRRHYADHVEHLWREVRERAVFDQEGDFTDVERGRGRVADGDFRDGRQGGRKGSRKGAENR